MARKPKLEKLKISAICFLLICRLVAALVSLVSLSKGSSPFSTVFFFFFFFFFRFCFSGFQMVFAFQAFHWHNVQDVTCAMQSLCQPSTEGRGFKSHLELRIFF